MNIDVSQREQEGDVVDVDLEGDGVVDAGRAEDWVGYFEVEEHNCLQLKSSEIVVQQESNSKSGIMQFIQIREDPRKKKLF